MALVAVGCSPADRPPGAEIHVPPPSGAATVPPCEPGTARECTVTLGWHGQVLTCFSGTQTCHDGVWGDCTDGTISEVTLPDPEEPTDDGSTQTQALSTPTGCDDNPCDPYCRSYDEVPDVPWTTETGDPSFPWQTGSLSHLPPGLVNKALQEPCETAAHCQFNSYCFAPSAGACAHAVCQTGGALDAGCSDCATAVCEEDPSCCGPVEPPPCAEGEVLGPSGATCYYFDAALATWSDARSACQARGAGWDLVSIESASENAFVESSMASASWMGLNDHALEGVFGWNDGPPLGPGDYENWQGNEPNDQGGEDCAELRDNGGWNDEGCAQSRASVCEGPSTAGNDCSHDPCVRGGALKANCNACVAEICATLPSCCDLDAGSWTAACVAEVAGTCGNRCECSPGETAWGGHCYTHSATRRTWNGARADCLGRGAGDWDLVQIGDRAENDFVRDLWGDPASTGDLWIGLTDGSGISSEGNWVWAGGDPAGVWNQTSGGALFENFQPWEPSSSDDCARMNDAPENGTWDGRPCYRTYRYVCEGEPSEMVLGPSTVVPGGWTDDCVDRVATACDARCDADDPGNTIGLCLPWYPGQTDPTCAGIDLAVDVPCDGVLPVCNHGNAEAPAGLRVIHFPANSGHYPSCYPDQSHAQMGECWTDAPIGPGECINVTTCDLSGNREIMVNPGGTDHVEECSCLDNWSLHHNGACGEPACSGGTSVARLIRTPVDIVFVIDNSGSMAGEIEQVEERINTDFASIIGASGIDYRVIMISRYGEVNTAVGDSNHPICIHAPLGADACADPASDPLQLNPPQFFHYSADIESWDSWCKLLYSFGSPDELDGDGRGAWTPVAPGGWSQWLRPDALKTFVVITDDDVDCGDYGYDFDDHNTASGGEVAAAAFDAALLALAPEQFGTAAERNYIWHSIVGMSAYAPADAAWPPTEPIQTGRCSSTQSEGPGTGYQALSVLTGGLRYPTCNNDNFDAIFQAIAENVIENADVSCSFELANQGAFDPAAATVQYSASNGATVALTEVAGEANCTNDGWYYDDPADPSLLTLCPDPCADLQSDPGAQIWAEIGCYGPPVPTTFTELYDGVCGEGAIQWGYLAWNAEVPGDARLVFRARAAATAADLPSAGFVNLVTVTGSNAVCPMTDAAGSCPVDVFEALGTPENREYALELEISILPSSDGLAPVLHSWELSYSCPPDE